MTIVAGVDFGTRSVRVSFVDSARGRIGCGEAAYDVGRDPRDPDCATQSHDQHLNSLVDAFAAARLDSGIDGSVIAALAVATTGSTVVPLDETLKPIDDYYLWCDHRAWREAEEISCFGHSLAALQYCGGVYSSEWGFAKLLHWLRNNPAKRASLATAAEHCDLIVATLTGVTDPAGMARSVCAMGHKWLWNSALGGLPDDAVLAAIDPLLGGLRDRFEGRYLTSDQIAGRLSEQWAAKLHLSAGIPVPVAALDAHWDAIGAGCRLGDVVNVVGTSSCIMALSQSARAMPGIPGVVPGSIHPGLVGIEAGLAAVGDVFDSIARRAGSSVAQLAGQCAGHRAGQTGLIRLLWDNGDRSVLADPGLGGATLGWRLSHGPADELFAAMEGSAFHTRIILDRLAGHDVEIRRVINGGGIPRRNAKLNSVYANILGKPVLVPDEDVTGLGSAIFAFLAAGTFASVADAQDVLCPPYRIFEPEADEAALYEQEYARFHELYFALSQQQGARHAVA